VVEIEKNTLVYEKGPERSPDSGAGLGRYS